MGACAGAGLASTDGVLGAGRFWPAAVAAIRIALQKAVLIMLEKLRTARDAVSGPVLP